MVEQGMLPLDPATGEVATFFGPRGDMTTADLTNPATREYIAGFLTERSVTSVSMAGWQTSRWLPIDADVYEGDAAAVHNRYPELWQSITREVMEAERLMGTG